MFDDWTKTWFRFEGETPAIYIVDADRNESLVNFRTEGPYAVVDKVSFRWTLRNCQDSTCVFNRRRTNIDEPNGLEPYAHQRTGATDMGAITAFYTVLAEGEAEFDPVVDETDVGGEAKP